MRTGRVIATTTTVAAMTAGLLGGLATPSMANAGDVWTITNTGGIGVWSRSAAFESATTGPGPAEGATVVDICQVMDGDPQGAYGNRGWHFVHTDYSGDIWVADTYLNTPNNANEPTPGTPFCTTNSGVPDVAATQQDAAATWSGPITSGNQYDRDSAVNFALAHAQDPEDFPAACTWFASQVLWAGGLPTSAEWNADGSHGILQPRPGTASATAVLPLRDHLLAAFPASTWEQIDLGANAVPDAQPGDLIFYDWNDGNGISHIAVVTDIVGDHYPNVAEWGVIDALEGQHPVTPYPTRGWTWSELSGQWLQEKFPGVQAYLLHIDSSTPITY